MARLANGTTPAHALTFTGRYGKLKYNIITIGQEEGNQKLIVLSIIMSLTGLLLLAAILNSRIKCRTRVEATVSDIIIDKLPTRGGTYVKQYTPVFSYSVNGKTYTGKADTTTMKAEKYFIGQTVSVYVDSDYPEAMRYGSNFGILLAGLVFLAIGVLILVLYFM